MLWILILRFWVEMFSLINLIFLTDENYFSISNLAKTITVAFNEPPESDEVCTNHEFATVRQEYLKSQEKPVQLMLRRY